MLIMQWCFPLCRQHAGRFASLFGASAKSEDANGSPKRTSSVMAMSLRNTPLEHQSPQACKHDFVAILNISPSHGTAPDRGKRAVSDDDDLQSSFVSAPIRPVHLANSAFVGFRGYKCLSMYNLAESAHPGMRQLMGRYRSGRPTSASRSRTVHACTLPRLMTACLYRNVPQPSVVNIFVALSKRSPRDCAIHACNETFLALLPSITKKQNSKRWMVGPADLRMRSLEEGL
jgi:hypothetical protein